MYWERVYKKYTMEQWERVIWPDECYIYLRDKWGHIFVTCRADEELHKDCLVPTFKQSLVQVMVWGSMMWGFKRVLHADEGEKGSDLFSAG